MNAYIQSFIKGNVDKPEELKMDDLPALPDLPESNLQYLAGFFPEITSIPVLSSLVKPNEVDKKSLINTDVQDRHALIIGCDYSNDKEKNLDGCVTDAYSIKEMLVGRFDFMPSNVSLLADDLIRKDCPMPTLENIKKELNSIISKTKKKNSFIYIHFSGLGDLDVKNHEAWLPYDYKNHGLFSSNEFKKSFLNQLGEKTTCLIVSDTSSYNNFLDLGFAYNPNTKKWKNTPIVNSKAKIILINGIEVTENNENKVNGVMTYCMSRLMVPKNNLLKIVDDATKQCKKLKLPQVPFISTNLKDLTTRNLA